MTQNLIAVSVTLLLTVADGYFLRQRVGTRMIRSPIYQPSEEYLSGTVGHKTMYMADITVGSEGQSFRVLIDSGSSQLVLPSVACNDAACQRHHRFAVNESTSVNRTGQTMRIGFSKGHVSGHVLQDVVCLGSGGEKVPLHTESFIQEPAGACVRMAFLAAESESDIFTNFPFDGILGLGSASDNVLSGRTEYSFLRAMVSSGKIDTATFAMKLTNDGDSELTLGGVEESSLANRRLSWWHLSPFATGAQWQFDINDLTLDGVPQNFGNIKVGVDSGTSLLAADDALKSWLQQHLGDGDGCSDVNHKPVLGLRRSDGTTLLLLPSDYVDNIDGECSLALMPHHSGANGERLLLGASFLRRYVTVFDRDNSQLGFGVAADDYHAPQLLKALFPKESPVAAQRDGNELQTALGAAFGDLPSSDKVKMSASDVNAAGVEKMEAPKRHRQDDDPDPHQQIGDKAIEQVFRFRRPEQGSSSRRALEMAMRKDFGKGYSGKSESNGNAYAGPYKIFKPSLA